MTKGRARILLILASIAFGALFLPGLGAAMMSPMMFDAPGSEKLRWLWGLLYSVLALPVATLVSIPVGWVLFVRQKYLAAVLVSLLPVLPLIVGGLFIASGYVH